MLITSKPRNNTLIHVPNIAHTSCIKYLGVYIDEHLDWHNQITSVNDKIAKSIIIMIIIIILRIFIQDKHFN